MPTAHLDSSLSRDSHFVGWLAAAMLAHALLLLVPAKRDQSSYQASPALAIALLRAAPPAPTAREPNLQERPDETVQEGLRSAAPEQQAAETTPVEESPAEPPGEFIPERQQPSTAYLLDLAGRQQWSVPETSATRHLGKHVPRAMPPNWRPAMRPEANRFDGMVAPAELEVVDRWLAADGSHNVVITAPDGETYCGRAEAWNPMNPLVEPIMSYRKCGGGGQRTFDMPHPYRTSTAVTVLP